MSDDILHTLFHVKIREAAQAILVTELRRINMEGRAKVVETWVQYLPQEIEGSSVLLESSDSDFGRFANIFVQPISTHELKLKNFISARFRATPWSPEILPQM